MGTASLAGTLSPKSEIIIITIEAIHSMDPLSSDPLLERIKRYFPIYCNLKIVFPQLIKLSIISPVKRHRLSTEAMSLLHSVITHCETGFSEVTLYPIHWSMCSDVKWHEWIGYSLFHLEYQSYSNFVSILYFKKLIIKNTLAAVTDGLIMWLLTPIKV